MKIFKKKHLPTYLPYYFQPMLPQLHHFFFRPKLIIDEVAIKKKLFNLDIIKSAGPDQIHPRVLYELRNEIAFPVKLIFEQTIK